MNEKDSRAFAPAHRPLHPKHAIEQVVFSFQVLPNQSINIVECAQQNIEVLRSQFDSMEPIKDVKIEFGNGDNLPQIQENNAAGYVFSSFFQDEIVGQLVIDRNGFLIKSFSYTRWNEVWARTQQIIQNVINGVNRPDLRIGSIGLQYVDKFIRVDNTREYIIGDLFNTESEYLTKRAVDAGRAWHIFQGWFDDIDLEERFLNQLNIHSAENEEKNHSTTIDHVIMTQFLGRNLKALGDFKRGGEEYFAILHAKNKKVLSSLLNIEMQKIIGLESNT